jgi:hypothetical protein
MSKTQINGAPFDQQAQVLVKTTVSYTANNSDNIIEGVGAGITVTLPASPVWGQRHRLVATTNALTLNGGGHTIAGSLTTVPANTAVDLTFSVANVWVGLCCGATGG